MDKQNKIPASRDLTLSIDLKLERTNGHDVLRVNQKLPLTGILTPLFVKNAPDHIENLLQMGGVNVFTTMVRDYFLKAAESMFSPQNVFEDTKLIITDPEVVPTSSTIELPQGDAPQKEDGQDLVVEEDDSADIEEEGLPTIDLTVEEVAKPEVAPPVKVNTSAGSVRNNDSRPIPKIIQ